MVSFARIWGLEDTLRKSLVLPNRREAILYAVKNAQPHDTIVLAGKGHEDYQEIKGVKHPMDERDLIRDILMEGHIPGSAAGQGL